MTAQRPTHAQLKEIVVELGMHMSDARIQEFLDVMQGTLEAYDVVDAMPDYLPPVLYPRTAGHRPSAEENPLNAWYVKTEVRGAPRGPLHGRTVALKDNVCLAGVPMMNGASTLKGYTPDVDATVVTRLLDAGATIVGKAHCEYFCLSGGSHTNATGPVENPHRPGYSAGGSSSGSGALVGGGLRGHGDRRRPGRLDPDPVVVLRLLRDEADPRTRPLHRRHADRVDHRPHRADDAERARQRRHACRRSPGRTGSTRASTTRRWTTTSARWGGARAACASRW